MCLFRFVRSQTEKLPRLHWSHSPQMIVKGTTIRSPFFNLPLTPEPTSTTSPIISWPMMSPGSIAGIRLWKRCRSEPQIAQLVTLMIASLGSWISGSVTVSHRISSLPCQTSALMPASVMRSGHKRWLEHLGLLRGVPKDVPVGARGQASVHCRYHPLDLSHLGERSGGHVNLTSAIQRREPLSQARTGSWRR